MMKKDFPYVQTQGLRLSAVTAILTDTGQTQFHTAILTDTGQTRFHTAILTSLGNF